MSTVVGNPIRLTASFADATGTLVDPTAVTVHLTLPDGTISTPAATRDSTGVYHYDYTTVQTGIHQYYFAGTGSNAAAQTPDIFTVSDGTTAALVSLYDVKAHLNKTQTVTTDDAELNRFIHGATAIVNHLCGWTVPTTFTETVTPSWGAGTDALGPYGSGYVPISVSKIPVMSVTAIQPKF